jgi:Protein of unknown function (DUF2442)/Helix-turn-helix
MSEATAIRIANVKYAGTGLRLIVRWTNNQEMTVNLEEPVSRLKGLRPLRTQAVFARAAVGEDGYSVTWPGDIDMGADRLWEMALEQNGHADAAEFIRWRWKHGLSLTAAAEALGLSRRTVAYYVSGEQEVPRTVLLALKGWEQEERKSALA